MLKVRNLDETSLQALAFELASSLKGRGALIGLQGPLGAGKTTFVKAFTQAFGIKQTKSPTFVITHQHRIPQGSLFHLDFYRLNKKSQLTDLGLTEMLQGKNLVLIEWVDRFPQIKKECDILITLNVKANNKRDIQIKHS
jgi:tRNA threonylcarbamoyladenosine biosynthesis protein TsaE